ncbi:PepSY-associated TM helix domain-containing protein [Aquiflexum gelatinilyticum]|uniref:PepSY domain-containing protein n=1 Tax=Aquiflexum gelatinilyticum TaxID=2961943 RepID=A0A9X2P5K2_9BACT|nr:PepSY-associated TM helix domain-containing protein [Aquiflexum gelatinilyticum]MCR9014698.1 PepSY domain-containing protein [Aquiflexum gelatinilyticum]MCS4434407.1 PepSY domain-containing protein [Aquiflexum gelatinilyticum]
MISKKAHQTRIYRRIHKWISIVFVFFLVVIGITAILLAWKKELGLIPKTQTTKVENPSNWIPLERMMEIGQTFVRDSLKKSDLIDRIDVRPEKGIAKIVFKRHFTEIQVDGYSGEILSVSQRNSDLVEKIHDGSILDFLMVSDSEISKITYSTLTSVVLLLLCFTGFFLWYLPRLIKKLKNRKAS